MEKIVTTRLSDNCVSDLKEIAQVEQLDTSATIRRLLAKAIVEWKINYALEKYQKGELSIGQASRLGGISIWDFLDLLKKRGMNITYDKEEFEEELKAIKWKKKR